jgi:hypothetical protein
MFASNPFAEISASIAPAVMQWYVVAMVVLVIAGTLFDVVHKGSARYFFENMRKPKGQGARSLGGGELISIAVQTGVVDVLTSGEFCNQRRRVAHLLGMYGFVLYLVTTIVMIFGYPTPATPTPAIVATLWWIGALMVCVGGYWFWFFIRVDVAAEGRPCTACHARGPVRALAVGERDARPDLGLAANERQRRGRRVLRSVHHRNDGAVRRRALVQVRPHVLQARGGLREKGIRSRRHGRESADPDPRRPEQQQRHSMELLRDAPKNMGLGIKREAPRHY